MKTLKSNISEAYKVQAACMKDSESVSYDKDDMKEKVVTLNNPKYLPWYLINGFECTAQNMSLSILFELRIKSKK